MFRYRMLKKTWSCRGALFLSALFVLASSANATPFTQSTWDLAEASDLVFVSTVTSVGPDHATVKVTRVLDGKWNSDFAIVSPVQIQHCVGKSVNFKVGEKVLIFGNAGAVLHRVVVVSRGYGKISLGHKNDDILITAVERLLRICRMKDEHRQNEAMLAEIHSTNKILHREACRYLVSKIARSPNRKQYKAQIVTLLNDPNLEIQAAALQAVQFFQSKEAILLEAKDVIPRIIELTRGKDLRLVQLASMALEPYDTPESTAAIIALTKHQDPSIRCRASVDLRRSKRPEAKQALLRLLDDKDPGVRAIDVCSFVYWFRRGEAADVLPRIIRMLDDPNVEVCAASARALSEFRDPKLVVPLLAMLKRKNLDPNVQLWVLRSLACHVAKDGHEARRLIDEDLETVIAALKKGPNDVYGSSLPIVEILGHSDKPEAREALRWAAKSHPRRETRAAAERYLRYDGLGRR